jgi:UDP-N-acetylglucosamine 2-epimerase (non-hydrolysing)
VSGRGQKRVLTVFGTRPEAIKLAPVIEAFERDPGFDARTVATAQHRDLLDQVLRLFAIRPDHDLDLMRTDQSLADLTGRALKELTRVLEEDSPDLVIVQGDTTTAMVGALASFYQGHPVAHVEAGLRSLDKRNPFPEEINRQIVTRIADLHFAPTDGNRRALLAEGVDGESIVVTGNSGIDTLVRAAASVEPERLEGLVPGLRSSGRRLLLVTLHRRESFGEPLARICAALKSIVTDYRDVEVLYPVHPNPNVRRIVERELGAVDRVRLVEPLGYLDFVCAMKASHLIVTDSGGVQEEAPSLETPVLVLRDVTERIEAVTVGAARLVGRDPRAVREEVDHLLTDEDARRRMMGHPNPYGDGRAAMRMVEAAREMLEMGAGCAAAGRTAGFSGTESSGGVADAS